MKTNVIVKPEVAVSAFYLFFIVHTIQTGAGIMGVPRILYLEAGHDAWISILIAGLYLHFIAWVMISILKEYDSADIIGIQCDLYGKYIGITIGIVFLIYQFFILLSVIKNYVEVVQVFIFPSIPIWLMSLFLLSLMIYCVLGGFRVVVGTSFIFFFMTVWLALTIYKPVTYMNWDNFLPIAQSGPLELLKGAQKTAYTVLGMEILLFVYPYIKNKEKVALPVHIALALTTSLILLVTTVSIGYFGPDHLEQTVWATLSLFKIISFPIIERFDFIAVAMWMMVVIPNIVLLCWMLIHTTNRMFNAPKKKSLYVISGLLFLASILIEYRIDINTLTDTTSKLGFWIVFVYPLFVFLSLKIRKLWRKRRRTT